MSFLVFLSKLFLLIFLTEKWPFELKVYVDKVRKFRNTCVVRLGLLKTKV